ncbi:hypothetical protein ILYODFUR_001812 [Ilyodon furcidens]|uniref:Uncharacterized protein n=1 Tax=Ilyodon furcidens TaxID=33524 RepID=A0ABV0U357_9TELE
MQRAQDKPWLTWVGHALQVFDMKKQQTATSSVSTAGRFFSPLSLQKVLAEDYTVFLSANFSVSTGWSAIIAGFFEAEPDWLAHLKEINSALVQIFRHFYRNSKWVQ